MKKILLSLMVLAVMAFGAAGAFAQGCAVTVSIATSATASSNCFVPAGQSFSYAITGTWAGTAELDSSYNNGVSWTTVLTTTANVASLIGPQNGNLIYRAYFTSRTSGTVTGSLLGLSPVAGRSIYPDVQLGTTALTSAGSATTGLTSGTMYTADVQIPRAMTVTTLAVLNGGTVGTNKYVLVLFDGSGRAIGNTAVAGTLTSGANSWQEIALTSAVSIPAGTYYIGMQVDGGTDNPQIQVTGKFVDSMTTSATGTFGTVPPAITPPTTFTTAVGPIGYVKGY